MRWLLSFAKEEIGAPCEHVVVSEGESFDGAFLFARRSGWVLDGQWDVTGWIIPEETLIRLSDADLQPGLAMIGEAAERVFGPRSVWDWRAARPRAGVPTSC